MSGAEGRQQGRGQGIAPDTGRQARLVALVIAGTMLIWLAAQWLGGSIGLPGRYVFLFDLLALAAFVWAFIVTYQIWRKRRDNQG